MLNKCKNRKGREKTVGEEAQEQSSDIVVSGLGILFASSVMDIMLEKPQVPSKKERPRKAYSV